MNVALILQARMGSTRLPGKILKPLAGKPMLQLEIERLRSAKLVQSIILATTDTPADDPVAALGTSLGLAVFRGSEKDVLERYYKAAKEAGAEVVVRVTGDCPFHNGSAIDRAVEKFLASGADYAAGPADAPEGFDTEVFSFAALERSAQEAALPSEREHVTLYIRNHPELFTVAEPWYRGGEDNSNIHLSVDTSEDFAVAEKIYAAVGEACGEQDIVRFLKDNPALRALNAGNTGYEGLHKSLKEDEAFALMRRLVLGTVELGLPYGLDSDIPQPSEAQSFEILDEAYRAGLRVLDTAAAYGSAEQVVGKWLASRGYKDMRVISKGESLADVRQSLARLGLSKLDGYLLHKNAAPDELAEAKRLGLVEHIGASVYAPDEIGAWCEYVQAPYNALDKRFGGVHGPTMFARSPFLQGLLLMSPAKVPERLAYVRPYLEQFIAIANQFNFTQLQAALLFVLHAEPAHYVVFGVKTLAQLQEIIAAAQTPLPEGFIDAMRALPEPPIEVLNPALWPK